MARRPLKAALLCLSVAGCLASGPWDPSARAGAGGRWDTADRDTLRLPPSAFPGLPEAVAEHLSERGCAILQGWFDDAPHNVVSGAFRRPDQIDWAVLCSVARHSVILVFWNGSAERVEEVPRSAGSGRDWLQGIGGERIGFSRLVGAVGDRDIRDLHDANGGPAPRPIDHEGIGDAFAGKAATVHYRHDGRWLVLSGAD